MVGYPVKKVALVCSHGGHLVELLQVLDVFQGDDVFFITYDSAQTRELNRAYLLENIGTSVRRMIVGTLKIARILIRERPDLIVSTGAELAIPTFYLARLMRQLGLAGTRTVFIESWTRVTMPTKTGKLVYPVSDAFLVQWPEMVDHYGPRARYGGIII